MVNLRKKGVDVGSVHLLKQTHYVLNVVCGAS